MNPPILFKYFPAKRLLFFYKPMLRFTPPSALNDPFEGKAACKGIMSPDYLGAELSANGGDMFEELKQSLHPMLQKIITANKDLLMKAVRTQIPAVSEMMNSKDMRNKLNENITAKVDEKGIGILSLSELKDSLLMWAHYCQDHTGFVVGFDTSHTFFDRRKQNNDLFNSVRRVIYTTKRPNEYLSDQFPESFFRDLLGTKSEEEGINNFV